MSKVPLFRGADGGLRSYLKACNMDLRDDSIKPSPRLLRKGISPNWMGAPAPTIVRWTYSGLPRPWFAIYDYLVIWYGATEQGASHIGTPVTDLCPFEDGSGNGALIVCYGNGDWIDRVDTTPTFTASTEVKLVLATMAGADLYGVTAKGVYSTYKVSKCPAGNDPRVVASWGTGLPVGSPVYAINSLRSIGNAIVCGKPEGVFVLDSTANAYVNRMKWLTNCPHTDNCKGMFETKTGVCIPLADGSLFLFDGYSTTDISPRKFSHQHRDAPHLRARITAGCDAGEWTYVATAPWEQNWTAEQGLVVYKCESGTPDVYTDISANLIDGDDDTTYSIEGLGNAKTDYIIFGADVPFEGVNIKMAGVATAGTTDTGGPQYWNGTAWTTMGGGRRNDFQDNVFFAKSGFTFWRDFYTSHSSMSKSTAAVPPWTAAPTKYWVRFAIGTTAVAGVGVADTTIAGIQILPSRPPVSNAAALAYTGPDAAGRFSHILAGREGPNGKWEWYDLFAVPVDSEIVAMAMMEMDSGQAEENKGPRLIMVSQWSRFYALMGTSMMPATPVNENYADGNAVGTPIVYFLPTTLSDSDTDRTTIQKKITEFDIYGEYVNSSDTATMLSRFDHNAWDTAQAVSTAPVRVRGPKGAEGLVLEAALAYEDPNATEIAGPRITRVDVEFRDTDADFDAHPQGNATTPEIE